MALTINKKRLLLVEGKDEEIFFNELLKLKGIDTIQAISLDGKPNLTCNDFINNKFMTALKSSDVTIQAVGIVLDCDDGQVQDCVNRVNTFVDKVNKHKPKGNEADIISFDKIKKCNQFTSKKTPLGLYVMPDCEASGALETLCLQAVKYNDFMPCIENFMNCLETINPDISHKHKRKSLAYLAASSERCQQIRIGHGIQTGLFDLESDIFNSVKDFIQQLSEI